MAYAAIADVQRLIAQWPLSNTSTPTTAQATAITDDTAAEIDARLASVGVTVPVTAPASFLRALALLNGYGAAAAILKSMLPGATGPDETPAYAFWEKRYQDGLAALISGDGTIPPDVIGSSSSVLPSTYLTENPDTELRIGRNAEPMFPVHKVY
jgi:hypothetical protein